MHGPTIHLVCPLSNAFGGSEQRAADYFALLSSRADVTLWAEEEPRGELARLPFRRLDPANGDLPEGGTLVLIGIFIERGHWLARTRPERLVIVYNTPERYRLGRLLDFIARAGLPPAELVFPSETHRASTRMAGFVDWGFFDFEAFTPARRVPDSGRFTVGRLSRDEGYKHHPQDIRLYRHLADRGMRVRLMGASVLRERLGDRESIEVLDAGAIEAPGFLQSLDAFIYRTGPVWSEPSGRVVVEAMACELPVVVGRNGGYRELVEHGTNGFLFDTQLEAVGYLEALRSDPALARRVGLSARATVVARFGASHIARVREFFLQPAGQPEGDSQHS
ncbi:MAG: glycosyltransferase family 4 protein [Pseudomonadota bacterium]|nr:glycosyltransferase family 4 protein [Pseudomonadota bacterium]